MRSFSRVLLNKPLLTSLWSQYPQTWKYILNIGLFLKYKTIKFEKLPTYIKLPSSFPLHINPQENRGRALLISNGVTQGAIVNFWKRSVDAFSPTTVLDIGVNYGECLFSVKYPTETKIYGIEANEQLIPFIHKSLSEHPNKRQIKIIKAFASNHHQQTQDFYIDKNWSGTSSGKEIYSQMVEKRLVQTITVDSLLNELDFCQESILFKIDVEGFEAFVLEGMKQVISQCRSLLGIIEFDSSYIKNSGKDLNSFLFYLSSNFHLYILDSFGELHPLPEVTMDKLQTIFKSTEIHTDLVLVKPGVDIKEIFF